uniref:Uncharacterized protein n=1 Tax=viral metagenome TaxID=1070528 RepID=A0A6C0KQ52_9ZZZZ
MIIYHPALIKVNFEIYYFNFFSFPKTIINFIFIKSIL